MSSECVCFFLVRIIIIALWVSPKDFIPIRGRPLFVKQGMSKLMGYCKRLAKRGLVFVDVNRFFIWVVEARYLGKIPGK